MSASLADELRATPTITDDVGLTARPARQPCTSRLQVERSSCKYYSGQRTINLGDRDGASCLNQSSNTEESGGRELHVDQALVAGLVEHHRKQPFLCTDPALFRRCADEGCTKWHVLERTVGLMEDSQDWIGG